MGVFFHNLIWLIFTLLCFIDAVSVGFLSHAHSFFSLSHSLFSHGNSHRICAFRKMVRKKKKTIDFEHPDFLNKSLHTNNSIQSWLLFWNFHFYVSKHNKCSLASCHGIKMFCHLELAWSLRVRFCHWKRNRWPTVSPHTFIRQISLSIKGIWPESSHISKLSSHLCTVSLTETRKVGETRSRPLRVDSYKYICFFKIKYRYKLSSPLQKGNRLINEINRYGAAVFSTVSSKQGGSGLVDGALNEAGINWLGFTLLMQKTLNTSCDKLNDVK